MATISGKDGQVNDFDDITGWSINVTSNNSAYASSSTAGWKKRVAGVRDWSGSFSGKFNDVLPVAEGEEVALTLALDDTDSFSGTAVIDQISLQVDVDNGDVVGFTANFSGSGELTSPAAAS